MNRQREESKIELLLAESGGVAVLHIFSNGTEISTLTGTPEGVRKVVKAQFKDAALRRVGEHGANKANGTHGTNGRNRKVNTL